MSRYILENVVHTTRKITSDGCVMMCTRNLILNCNVNVLHFQKMNTTYVLDKITLMFANNSSEYTM